MLVLQKLIKMSLPVHLLLNDYIKYSATQEFEKIKMLLNSQPQAYKLCSHYMNMRDNLRMNICERLYFH